MTIVTVKTHDLFDRGNRDRAVGDSPRPCHGAEHLEDASRFVIVEQELDLELGSKRYDVFDITIEIDVAPVRPGHLGHGHSLDTLAGEGGLHLVELEGLHDGLDLFHFASPLPVVVPREPVFGAGA